MAIVRAYYGTDMGGQIGSDSLYYYGTVTIQTSSHIRIAYGGEALNYYGQFNYNQGTGTLTRLDYTYLGNKVFEVYGGSWDLLDLLDHFPYIDNFVFRGADKMYGSFESDVFIGYGGNDRLFGRGGDDTLYGNAGNDFIYGGANNDLLYGGGGNDLLNGGGGGDTMRGGSGNDIYLVNSALDTVIEIAGQGTDTVNSSINYTLGTNVERLILLGGNPITGTGNELNNFLTGNSANNILIGLDGNDRLNGMAGADTMLGGMGNDLYFVDDINDTVTENVDEGFDKVRSSVSYTLGANIEKLILQGSGNINATGNTLDNMLIGNGKANILDGASGDDTMKGRGGNDTYIVDTAGDTVIEKANQGNDLVLSSVDFSLDNHVERLTLTGLLSIDGTGNSSANTITGNDADNTLRGLGGNDLLKGRDGNDLLLGHNGNDTLKGGAGDDILIGGAGNDRLFGGSGSDTASYQNAKSGVEVKLNLTSAQNTGEGTDTLRDIENLLGSDYDDRLFGDGGDNTISAGFGDDLLVGRGGNDVLLGNNGNDTLRGGAGNDTLTGDAGNDAIKGGSGSDTFVLNSLSGTDLFLDFSIDEDTLQLDSSIFTGLTETADELDASAFLSSEVLSFNEVLSGPTILYESSTGDIYYDADGVTSDNAQLIASVTDWLSLSNTNIDLT